MKNEREIHDRRDGCVNELQGNLHPQVSNGYNAAILQGWVNALSWVLEMDSYDREGDVKELLGVERREDINKDSS